jgi:hypothetical protein
MMLRPFVHRVLRIMCTLSPSALAGECRVNSPRLQMSMFRRQRRLYCEVNTGGEFYFLVAVFCLVLSYIFIT